MDTATDSLAFRIALSLAIGLLVGLERGWREREAPEGSRTAGFRTFALTGLLGGLSAALSQAIGDSLVLATGLVAFAAVFGAFKFREALHDADFSVTTVIAGLAVFTLGALAVAGDFRIAAAGGATVAALLASRVALHGFLRQITWVELRSAILLGAMTMIGLSVLPDRTLDPWGGFNPWEIWFLTVLTATISYAGYIAMRVLGSARGLLVSGLAGGLVSSTATVAALSRAGADEHARQRSGAAVLACMVSLLRVGVLIWIVERSVLPSALPVLLPAAVALGVTGILILARPRADGGALKSPTGNPFDLGSLLAFAGLFGAVSLVGAALVARFGSASIVATSALSGLVDVDVASLTALRLVEQGVPAQVATIAVVAAVAVNACSRIVLAVSLGPKRFWLPFALATAAAFAAGLAGGVFWPIAVALSPG